MDKRGMSSGGKGKIRMMLIKVLRQVDSCGENTDIKSERGRIIQRGGGTLNPLASRRRDPKTEGQVLVVHFDGQSTKGGGGRAGKTKYSE